MPVSRLSVRWLPIDSKLSYEEDELMITMSDGATMPFREAWNHITKGQRWVRFQGWQGAYGHQETIRSPYL